jgi:hypothetical protein
MNGPKMEDIARVADDVEDVDVELFRPPFWVAFTFKRV